MRLIDHIEAAVAEEVIAAYRRHYDPDDWASVDVFERFRTAMRNAVGPRDDVRLEVRRICWERGYESGVSYDVSGLRPGDDQRCAIWMDDWGTMKLREVDAPEGLSADETLCHIYWEMSWRGPAKQVLDRADRAARAARRDRPARGHSPAR